MQMPFVQNGHVVYHQKYAAYQVPDQSPACYSSVQIAVRLSVLCFTFIFMREGTYCLKAAFLIEIWPVSAFIFQDSIPTTSLSSTPHSKIACQESLKPLTKYIEFGPGFSSTWNTRSVLQTAHIPVYCAAFFLFFY
jgi:hypothetical protein